MSGPLASEIAATVTEDMVEKLDLGGDCVRAL